MTDVSNEQQFGGFEHNTYQANMHTLAMWSLWMIIIAGVACGIFGFFWGLAH